MRSSHQGRSLNRSTPIAMLAPIAIGLLVLVVASTAIAQNSLDSLAVEALQDLADNDNNQTHAAPYFFVGGAAGETDPLPLERTHASVQITGVIAQVTLLQTYKNEGSKILEAIYLFPASTTAALHGMSMTIGQRTIKAVIKKREEAREDYENALAEGRSASLLEQKRPNVFQMSVGNILPGDVIDVELTYTELLIPKDATYEFMLPNVVGPRYASRSSNMEDEFNNEWVANPYLQSGEDLPFDTLIDVKIASGIPISHVDSPSHKVDIRFTGKKRVEISCEEPGTAGDRDFIVRYSLADKQIETGLLTYQNNKGNYFLAMIEPPPAPDRSQILPKEFVFVLDVSGSMHGFPLDLSKELMGNILSDLDKNDRFNILEFAGNSAVFSDKPVRATPRNIERALGWVGTMRGGGGTELLPALKRTFALPKAKGYSRTIMVATDGFVHVEDEAYRLVKQNLGKANLFAYGIGTSVNRLLIERLARAGMGEPIVVTNAQEARREGQRFRRDVAAPLLTDIRLKSNGFQIIDSSPKKIPDLFASKPILVFGKYKGNRSGSITVSGRSAAGKWSKKIRLTSEGVGTQDGSLSYLYARKMVQQLSDQLAWQPSLKLENKVTKLGLEYSMLTAYTSFVAVDTVVRTDGSKTKTVTQPLPLPRHVSDLAVGEGRVRHMRKASRSAGVLGTLGYGGGGGTGSGYGSGGFGSIARAPAPRIRSGSARVMGSLPKEVIRRIVHRQTNQVRACYEAQLQNHPQLKGRVVVKFVIDTKGHVIKAVIETTTLYNAKVEECLINVVNNMRFPTPENGGVVVVAYPFSFTSPAN